MDVDGSVALTRQPAEDPGDSPLMVRELTPLAALDAAPTDFREACEDLADDPVWTALLTPYTGDAMLYKPGALGAKAVSSVRFASPAAAFSFIKRGRLPLPAAGVGTLFAPTGLGFLATIVQGR